MRLTAEQRDLVAKFKRNPETWLQELKQSGGTQEMLNERLAYFQSRVDEEAPGWSPQRPL